MRIEATGISEAIRIATEGARSGRWDLFRGQSDADWPVTSSAERLSESARKEAFKRATDFAAWAQSVPAMNGYVINMDSLWAIAQHYGLATLFIDFSDDPRVAAFFAADTDRDYEKGHRAALICVNTLNFNRFWEYAGPTLFEKIEKPAYPEFIRIDVENLWRLQQQKGSFLWNPVFGIERFYEFDRIIFPYEKNDPAIPAKHEIYPLDQSDLEKILTRFFMNEKMREAADFIDSLDVAKFDWPVESYEVASWAHEDVPVSEDWTNTAAWNAIQVQHASSALPGTLIDVDLSGALEQIAGEFTVTLSPEFIEKNRNGVLTIRPSMEPNKSQRLLIACVRRLWNGMRTLPYGPDEINTALRRMLELFPVAQEKSHRQAMGPESLYVEMAHNVDGRGGYSRADLDPKTLIEVSNPAFAAAADKYLAANYPTLARTPYVFGHALLQLAGRPWERFTFSGLRRAMVEELIPTQIAWRMISDEHDLSTVIYFSPTDIKVFGLA